VLYQKYGLQMMMKIFENEGFYFSLTAQTPNDYFDLRIFVAVDS